MKILHVTNYDNNLGGAGIAAHRLHTALRKAGIDSRMLVRTKGTSDPFVSEVGDQRPELSSSMPRAPCAMLSRRFAVRARGWLGARLVKALGMDGCSLSIFPTGLHKILNASDADVIHLHWINNEMISIREIAKITKPLVWTLHDMWPLLGAEHYPAETEIRGQTSEDREQRSATDVCEAGDSLANKHSGSMPHAPCSWLSLAVNNWIFRRKQKAWRNLRVSFIAPSCWMAEQVRKSELFADAPVEVILNCLDLEIFQPLEQTECRKKWNLPLDKKLILFGAYDPSDPRKGCDLLEKALRQLPEETREKLGVAVFGSDGEQKIGGLDTYWLGKISNDRALAEVYSAVDLFVCPSRADNLPTTVAEALACGIPSVGFDVGGIPDMIEHEKTGWLARPFDTEDFAAGIQWILQRKQKPATPTAWSAACRSKAKEMFSEEAVSPKHLSVCAAAYRTDLGADILPLRRI